MVHTEGHTDPASASKSEDQKSSNSPPRTSDTRSAAELLCMQPAPLIDPQAGFGVLWSAKVGSKAILSWFFCRIGQLEEARNYPEPGRPRVHQFRNRVLLESSEYKQWLKTCDPTKLKWLRIIRNPYTRAVSSYRHALGSRSGYEDRKIKEVLNLSVPDRGLSFQEFLDYLLAIDVASCNNHHRQQWHPIEAHVTPHKVVNLDKDSMLPALDAFEKEIGLQPVSPEAREKLLSSWEHEARRHHTRTEEVEDSASIVFTRQEAKPRKGQKPEKTLPSYASFLNADTRRKIERIYAKDFDAYGDYL